MVRAHDLARSAPRHCAPRPGNPVGCADAVPDAGALPGNVAPIAPARSCSPAGAEFRTSGSRLESAVALTFDDGPGPATAAILSELEREGAPATFFVVGEHIAGHEGLLRSMLADGDVIGDHSFSHADLAKNGMLARRQGPISYGPAGATAVAGASRRARVAVEIDQCHQVAPAGRAREA